MEWGLWSFWLAPPRLWGGSVFYRRMVWLLPLVSSNVIVTCLVPSRPCGVGPVVVLVGPAPPVWGSVFYKDMYGMVVMSSLRARYHTKWLSSPCKRCPCPCSDAVHSPSSPPSGLRGFVPVVRDRWEQGRFGGTGAGGREGGRDTMGGGVGARDPRACIHSPTSHCPLPQAPKIQSKLSEPET